MKKENALGKPEEEHEELVSLYKIADSMNCGWIYCEEESDKRGHSRLDNRSQENKK